MSLQRELKDKPKRFRNKKEQKQVREFYTPIALGVLATSKDEKLIALALRNLANIIEDTDEPLT